MARRLASALALLLLTASPAGAYLVEVTTSVSIEDSGDERAVQDALLAAVDGVLKGAIAFTPTLIVVTSATLVGGRLHVRLLVADREGERTFHELNAIPDIPGPVDLRI